MIVYVYVGRVPAPFNNSARDPKLKRLTFSCAGCMGERPSQTGDKNICKVTRK